MSEEGKILIFSRKTMKAGYEAGYCFKHIIQKHKHHVWNLRAVLKNSK